MTPRPDRYNRAVARVLNADTCSGCGACALINPDYATRLNAAGYNRPVKTGSTPFTRAQLATRTADFEASGIAGALALVHTDNGRIDLTQQASSGDFPRYDAPVLPLSDDTRGIYGDITGEFIQDVNLTPNFPVSGALAAEMWRLQFGVTVDGVISLDPVTLSYLLAATGPITLPTGDVLTAENTVQLLLADVYTRYSSPADQDTFFAAAASSVFEAVAGGSANPVQLIAALARAGAEHRTLIYNVRPDEQAVLANTTIAGGLAVSTAAEKRFGVYFNEGTSSKMNSFLDVKLAVGQAVCRGDERPQFAVTVTLTNTAPADAATALPPYIAGSGANGIADAHVNPLVSVYGAPDMQNLGLPSLSTLSKAPGSSRIVS